MANLSFITFEDCDIKVDNEEKFEQKIPIFSIKLSKSRRKIQVKV